jgi:hypothetical protein
MGCGGGERDGGLLSLLGTPPFCGVGHCFLELLEGGTQLSVSTGVGEYSIFEIFPKVGFKATCGMNIFQ